MSANILRDIGNDAAVIFGRPGPLPEMRAIERAAIASDTNMAEAVVNGHTVAAKVFYRRDVAGRHVRWRLDGRSVAWADVLRAVWHAGGAE